MKGPNGLAEGGAWGETGQPSIGDGATEIFGKINASPLNPFEGTSGDLLEAIPVLPDHSLALFSVELEGRISLLRYECGPPRSHRGALWADLEAQLKARQSYEQATGEATWRHGAAFWDLRGMK